jgi:hypothetical protein
MAALVAFYTRLAPLAIPQDHCPWQQVVLINHNGASTR